MPALAVAVALVLAAPQHSPAPCPDECQLHFEMGDSGVRKSNLHVTAAVLIAAVVVVAAWDAFAWPTESRVIADLSMHWTILPLAVGVLAGHWFWHGVSDDRPGVMGAIAGAFLAWDLSLLLRGPPHGIEATLRNPIVPLAVGFLVGHFLWSQRCHRE